MPTQHTRESDDERPNSPPPGIQNPLADDTIKILLATDNHIGYLERDPIRGQDSINSFREVLQLAVKHDVDFVLLAGDLFHENKPSRDCLYRTIALLREYTLGDKPIQIELLSDPDEGKAAGFSFPAVNYEDPNLNVAIPVFSIHGNHDDPQGVGSDGALCALDVLSVSGLVNYMGKFDLPISDADAANTGIAVRPVLLRKGSTRLGMYGIGNVKDARMHFELRSNRVRMYMPKDKNDWFNILLLHQNRVKHGPQESVPEGMFDDSIDLVVWGHEHDCRIQPESVAGKNYYIVQPGSSVATSLADGESIEKHVALLEIQGKEFQLTPLPLRTVRPFVIESIVLSEVAEKEGLDINDQTKIMKYLKAKVNELIDAADGQMKERNAKALEEGDEELDPMLPLVRLKVETTGVTEMFNPVRFGQEFYGRVANPRDVLTLHRTKHRAAISKKSKVNIDEPDLDVDHGGGGEDGDESISDKLAKVQMGQLVKDYLKAQELQLLPENGMSDAIQMFVEKDDIHAINTHVNHALSVLIKGVQAEGEIDEGELDDIVARAKEHHEQEYAEMVRQGKVIKAAKKGAKGKAAAPDPESDDSMMMDIEGGGGGGGGGGDDDDDDDDFEDRAPPARGKGRAAAAGRSTATKQTTARAATAARGKKKVAAKDNYDDGDDDDEVEVMPPPKKRATVVAGRGRAGSAAPARKTPAATGRGKKKVIEDDDDDDEVIDITNNMNDDDDDILEIDEPPKAQPAKKTNRAAILSQTTTARKTPAASKRKTPAPRQQTQLTITATAPAAARPGRAAASRARGRITVDDDDDE